MRKRFRPLDAHEERDVEKDQMLELEILRDESEYILKWPTAPLTAFLKGTTEQPSRHVPVIPMEAVCHLEPPPSSAAPPRRVQPRAAGWGRFDSVFVFTDSQARAFARKLGVCLSSPRQTMIGREVIEAAEQRAFDEQKRSAAIPRLLQLSSAVRFEDVLAQLRTSPQAKRLDDDDVHTARAAYDMWIEARDQFATRDRPWGAVLMQKYFIGSDNDEYFIPVGHVGDGAAAPGSSTSGTDTAVLGRREGHCLRLSQKKGPFSYMSYDCRKLTKVPGEKDMEAFVRSLPPLLELGVNHTLQRLNDLGPEIRDCSRWVHSVS
jgi:hypothetical protein